VLSPGDPPVAGGVLNGVWATASVASGAAASACVGARDDRGEPDQRLLSRAITSIRPFVVWGHDPGPPPTHDSIEVGQTAVAITASSARPLTAQLLFFSTSGSRFDILPTVFTTSRDQTLRRAFDEGAVFWICEFTVMLL